MSRRLLQCLWGIVVLFMLADFLVRGVGTAMNPGRTDFTEIYVGAWLFRHGQNFYDASLTTAMAGKLASVKVQTALVYPPTTLLLFVPFTFLPWNYANLAWLLLGLGGIGCTTAILLRLGGFHFRDDRALALITLVLAFSPLHQAFHLGNVALAAVPLCLFGVYLAEKRQDYAAGAILALATALKPQLGMWILVFYLLRLRKRILIGVIVPAVVFAIALAEYPIPVAELLASYHQNFRYWFAPGRPFGFTEGAFPFHVNTIQVVLYPVLRNVTATNGLAHFIFLMGLAIWAYSLWKSRFQVPVALALSSLSALSFISLYHSVADVTVLTLSLCWALQTRGVPDWAERATCFVFLLMMMPGHSILMRGAPHLSSWVTQSWWWKFLVARYFVWLLLALNVTLLYALVISVRRNSASSPGPRAPSQPQGSLAPHLSPLVHANGR